MSVVAEASRARAAVALRRWGSAMPAGAFTVLCRLNALMVGVTRDQHALVLPAIGAGIVIDVLVRRLRGLWWSVPV